ncbi:hypothetical protein [Rhodococcus sp. 1168]|uniref:hypothetical protein n=1 Tax=Rhodococcus sp. 1168 TaxID=2018041 RepID=UPI000A0D797F|nr:hypothetical protein [Rhodococcus sp. 1168]ORI13549.1 hypothetical protein BJI47_23290 [Rhodococcus sp. 1168]
MIALHEEHGEIIASWDRLGYCGESIVCFDRHLDLKPLSARAAADLDAAAQIGELDAQNRRLPIREVEGSYGLDDFYAAGAALGHVSMLTWVQSYDGPDSPQQRRRLLNQVAPIRADRETLLGTSFTDQGALTTTLCGLTLTIATPSMFAAQAPAAATRVDLDLDWFADTVGGIDYEPKDLLALLDIHNLRSRVDSMTYSIRSGFLPESMRYLADTIATELHTSTEQHERDAIDLPRRTFAALRGGATENTALIAAELEPLGPIGLVLRGILAVKSGDVDMATQCWTDAAAARYESSWLAYTIGLQFYAQRNFGAASAWLTRAIGDGVDTVEVKSRFLGALCDVRLGDTATGHDKLLDFAWDFPLHVGATALSIELGPTLTRETPEFLLDQATRHRELIGAER